MPPQPMTVRDAVPAVRHPADTTSLLRPSRAADVQGLAELHVAVWRETYRALATPEAFADCDLACRREGWLKTLSDPTRIALVAEVGPAIVGFGVAGPPGDPAFGARGEVKSLYVDGRVARCGIGRRLLTGLAGALQARAYAGVALGVVVGNEPAIAFYEAMGGRRIGAYTDRGPLWRSSNLVYAWDDLNALAARG